MNVKTQNDFSPLEIFQRPPVINRRKFPGTKLLKFWYTIPYLDINISSETKPKGITDAITIFH